MKLSLRFATFSLLLAAAAATLEGSSLYDAAVPNSRSVPAHSYDLAHTRKYSHSTHVRPSVKLAHSSSQNSPSKHAYEGSGTIKPASAGKCHSIGATGITRSVHKSPGRF